jgi:hypothetical protein
MNSDDPPLGEHVPQTRAKHGGIGAGLVLGRLVLLRLIVDRAPQPRRVRWGSWVFDSLQAVARGDTTAEERGLHVPSST